MDKKHLRERYTSGTYDGTLLKEGGEDFIKAVSKKGISLEELNFKKNVIGSDETGIGEVFRPSVVVAAYVKKENVEKLIEMDIMDSKSYKAYIRKGQKDERVKYETVKQKIYDRGKKLTGFTSYKDFVEQGGSKIVIEKDYVKFVANVISNEVYNEKWKSKKTKNGSLSNHELMREWHAAAVNSLAKEEYDYVVVDNFEKSHPESIQTEIDLPEEKMIIAEKADKFTMAVACASVIAKYLSYLYMEKVAADYGLDEFEDFGRTGEFEDAIRDRLWGKLENPQLYFRNYVKKFDNVIDSLNRKEEGLGELYNEAT